MFVSASGTSLSAFCHRLDFNEGVAVWVLATTRLADTSADCRKLAACVALDGVPNFDDRKNGGAFQLTSADLLANFVFGMFLAGSHRGLLPGLVPHDGKNRRGRERECTDHRRRDRPRLNLAGFSTHRTLQGVDRLAARWLNPAFAYR